jgi:hypothetical protein
LARAVLEQLGGLVAQVVGHMVFDGQHGEGVVRRSWLAVRAAA